MLNKCVKFFGRVFLLLASLFLLVIIEMGGLFLILAVLFLGIIIGLAW